MGIGDGASARVRSTTQAMPTQMPPFSSMTRLVSRLETPVVTTSSAMMQRSPGLILKRFAIHPGEKCLIAEDVVTTGISSLETKRVIEENGGICLGITCVVDRTKPEAPSPIPIVASALKLDLPNYAPEECPICKEGKLPLVHLGSRKMKQEAKQTL